MSPFDALTLATHTTLRYYEGPATFLPMTLYLPQLETLRLRTWSVDFNSLKILERPDLAYRKTFSHFELIMQPTVLDPHLHFDRFPNLTKLKLSFITNANDVMTTLTELPLLQLSIEGTF